jgi:hypothetical protein
MFCRSAAAYSLAATLCRAAWYAGEDMQIMFALALVSFFAMLWAGFGLTRHIRRKAALKSARKELRGSRLSQRAPDPRT